MAPRRNAVPPSKVAALSLVCMVDVPYDVQGSPGSEGEWHETSVCGWLLPESVGTRCRNYAGGGARATCSRSLRGGYSRNALQVVCDLKVLPFVEQVLDAFDDSAADLDDQPPA